MRAHLDDRFRGAQHWIDRAIGELGALRATYERSSVPDRKARIRALDAKVDALRAVHLDAKAYPWSEDFV